MRATVLYSPGDVRCVEVEEPKILAPAGVGADSVLECVGTNESMMQAIQCARPGGKIGFVGVPRSVQLDGQFLFFQQKSVMGGLPPVRRFLPHLMDLVLSRTINPCRSGMWRKATALWTNGRRSRRCCVCDLIIA